MMAWHPRLPAIDRFPNFIEIASNGCHNWLGGIYQNGYGAFTADGSRAVKAHRWAYENYVGPVPKGMELDHLCRNKRCVNTEHLEPVKPKENVRRAKPFLPTHYNLLKTHCPKGHPYSEENTYRSKNGRNCRTCTRARREKAL